MYVKVIPCKFWKFRKVNSYVVELYREKEIYFFKYCDFTGLSKNSCLVNFLF